jgi:hypothetical protein
MVNFPFSTQHPAHTSLSRRHDRQQRQRSFIFQSVTKAVYHAMDGDIKKIHTHTQGGKDVSCAFISNHRSKAYSATTKEREERKNVNDIFRAESSEREKCLIDG